MGIGVMHITRRHRADWRRLAALVALLAVLSRALIPFGWMPSRATSGAGFQIVICTLSGQKHLVLDQNGKPVPVDSDNQAPTDHSTCPFAASSDTAPPVLTVILLSADQQDAVVLPGPESRIPAQPARASWQSRAPPLQLSIA
jgi:hypothetical protein